MPARISDAGQSRISFVTDRTLKDNVRLSRTISLTIQHYEIHLRTPLFFAFLCIYTLANFNHFIKSAKLTNISICLFHDVGGEGFAAAKADEACSHQERK